MKLALVPIDREEEGVMVAVDDPREAGGAGVDAATNH